MVRPRSQEYLKGLVRELAKTAKESTTVEFKHNNDDPERIGQYISALANSAAIEHQPIGYLIWGIDDTTREILGTDFSPSTVKKGNEELESWLLRLLTPKLDFRFAEVDVDGRRVVLLEIDAAIHQPVRFKDIEYIRVGSYLKPIKRAPEKERELWRVFDRITFEKGIALEHISQQEVLGLIDHQAYIDLLNVPYGSINDIIENLLADEIIRVCPAGGFDITNLGAILLAKDIATFPSLARKAIRVIKYKTTSRIETEREQIGVRGYASGFSGLVSFVESYLPMNEVVQASIRRPVSAYPEIALRELIANALIHQDFTVSGSGPMIEIFSNRIEITNPGEPLVDVQRFINSPPRSRNEKLAGFMRRAGVCEERGSGIDKVVTAVEEVFLPAPLFEVPPGSTRAVLFGPKPFKKMDKDERLRAVYLHACLRYANRESLTNSSLRARFNIDEKNKSQVSRIIREAREADLIRPADESAGRRDMKYLPSWAV